MATIMSYESRSTKRIDQIKAKLKELKK